MKQVRKILSWPLITLVYFYRHVISPLKPTTCRYYPSCSVYTLRALKKHGLFVGLFLSIRRILWCHPWGGYGKDDVPEYFFILKRQAKRKKIPLTYSNYFNFSTYFKTLKYHDNDKQT
jgi:putative membrane protein insertion efficiency factor